MLKALQGNIVCSRFLHILVNISVHMCMYSSMYIYALVFGYDSVPTI